MILQGLNRWDPLGLSPGHGDDGAPFDEYLRYAISTRDFIFSHKGKTEPRHLAEFIAREFSTAFSLNRNNLITDQALHETAKDILHHLELLRANNPGRF